MAKEGVVEGRIYRTREVPGGASERLAAGLSLAWIWGVPSGMGPRENARTFLAPVGQERPG